MKRYTLFTVFLSLIALSALGKSLKPQLNVNGEKISDLSEWKEHREFIKFEMQDKIYGHLPKNLIPTFQTYPDVYLESINAYYRETKIRFEGLPDNKFLRLGLFIPEDLNQRAPVFLTLNKCGNHTLVDDPQVYIDQEIPHHSLHCKGAKGERGSLKSSYPVSKILKAGYIFATFDKSEMDADDPRLEDDGIQGLIQTHNTPEKSWGTLAAWAFGLITSVDYLSYDKDVDKNKIILTGHSRRGKAALIAAALDERVAMVIPHQSGMGGTARMDKAYLRESAKMISHGSRIYKYMGEPYGLTHWFAKEFKYWSKRIKKLPINSADIIALIAPRPLMDSQGSLDFWAGPRSSKKMVKRALSAWSLYGVAPIKKGQKLKSRNKISETKTGIVTHYIKRSSHKASEKYWDQFINFANLHFSN